MFFRLVCLVLFPALITGYKLQPNEGISARIVGGVTVDIENFPYQVSLVITHSSWRDVCGGVIVSESFIISAVHCIENVKKENITIRANSTSWQKGGSLHRIKKLHFHPKYYYFDYDLVVIELKKPLTFGYGIQPIRLPASDEQLPHRTILTISGWGATSESNREHGIPSPVLRAVNVSSYTSEECTILYDNDAPVTDRMIGGNVPGGGQNGCVGDSGGPVTHAGVVYGLVSWLYNVCASERYPMMFTRIAHPSLRAFIKKVTGI